MIVTIPRTIASGTINPTSDILKVGFPVWIELWFEAAAHVEISGG
jgi:hypothetical protein